MTVDLLFPYDLTFIPTCCHPKEPSRENLKIREDGCGGVFVETLSEHVVRDAEEIMALIKRGTRLRATNVTRMNKVYKGVLTV